MKNETRGTDAATVDDNRDEHSCDSCPVKIKEEPGGSDEKYVEMNSKSNDEQIIDIEGYNDNDDIEEWLSRTLSRYQPSSYFTFYVYFTFYLLLSLLPFWPW